MYGISVEKLVDPSEEAVDKDGVLFESSPVDVVV